MVNSPSRIPAFPRRALAILVLVSPLFLAMTCSKNNDSSPAANETKEVVKDKEKAPSAQVPQGPGVSAVAATNIEAEDRAYLETLQKQADAGDKDAIKQLCIRIRQEDVMPLNGYRPSEEFRASCAEMKIDDYPED